MQVATSSLPSVIAYQPPLIIDVIKPHVTTYMTINHIKSKIATENNLPSVVLTMSRQLAEDKKTPTVWLSHWDVDNRIRVTMHEEVFTTIKANPACDILAVKKEVVPAHKNTAGKDVASYIRYVVITPRNIEGTF